MIEHDLSLLHKVGAVGPHMHARRVLRVPELTPPLHVSESRIRLALAKKV
jgi:hypothetical protein